MTTHDISSRAGDETVRRVFAVVAEVLLKRGTVEIEGFGTFELVLRKPRAGESTAGPAKSVVKFKPAGSLKQRAAEKPPAGAT